ADAAGGPASAGFSDQLIAVLPRLRRFARGLTGAAAEADDLVQAACERALARHHQFQEGTRFDSWMFRIVQTIWIDQIRARDVRKEEPETEAEHIGSDEPMRRVEARLALAEVRLALQELPAEQRAALLLVTVDGLSYREAAAVAEVPVGTIMSRLARARVALQAKVVGGGFGYIIATRSPGGGGIVVQPQEQTIAASLNWLDNVAGYHKLFVNAGPNDVALVDIPADPQSNGGRKLALPQDFRLPDLK